MVQPLSYSHPVLSIKVGIVPFPSKFFESGTKSHCVVNQSQPCPLKALLTHTHM